MISKHFKREEFKCACCDFSFVDAELISVLEKMRSIFDSAIIINSGCRCDNHNKEIGGSEHSKHKLGIAADIVVKKASPYEVYRYLTSTYPYKFGIGRYDTFTHIDVRKERARW